MKFLKELLQINEAGIAKPTAAAVYHRDYLKTKKKPYRKYDPKKRAEQVKESISSFASYHLWISEMKKAGATRFEHVELDHVLAYNKDGRVIGTYDKRNGVAKDS